MEKKSVNYFRGYIRAKISGGEPERALNFCAGNGIEIWDAERADEFSVFVSVTRPGYGRLRRAAKRLGCNVEAEEYAGFPRLLRAFRGRFALIGGLAAVALTLFALSQYVWEIEVTGNETVSSVRILRELDNLGVKIGTRSSDVNSTETQYRLILAVPEVEWLAINVKGSRAVVEVREAVRKPDIVPQGEPCDVVALKSGLVIKIDTLEGSAQVKPGQTVEAGDLLVSGIIDSTAAGMRRVHAMADVTLRTWYSYDAVLQPEFIAKTYTGRVKKRYALVIGSKKINLYGDAGQKFAACDKTETRTALKLPPNLTLPVTIVAETFSEYAESSYAVSRPVAEDYLLAALTERAALDGAGGVIKDVRYGFYDTDGAVTCALTAECEEPGALTVKVT